MKKILFYINLLVLIVVIFYKVSFFEVINEKQIDISFNYSNYKLIERNIIEKNFISCLYKDDKNSYVSKNYDYKNSLEINIDDILKNKDILFFENKIQELLYLKYPKFVVEELLNDYIERNYLFRENEMIIYFNNYKLEFEANEQLYLKVNYNEIKKIIDFTVVMDSDYQNESGYDFTNSKKSIAITFDDSPNVNKTNKIISYLMDNLYHATFFIVGEKAINNEDLLLSIKNSGNEIGSHTYKHQNIKKLDDSELIEDYEKINFIYKRLFKKDVKLLRPPYGLYNKNKLELLNVSYIMWSLDTLDWKHRNSNYLVNYVLENVKDGDIILFHDSYDSTVNAIKELLPKLYLKGYQVMSVSELAKIKGYEIENNNVYFKFN